MRSIFVPSTFAIISSTSSIERASKLPSLPPLLKVTSYSLSVMRSTVTRSGLPSSSCALLLYSRTSESLASPTCLKLPISSGQPSSSRSAALTVLLPVGLPPPPSPVGGCALFPVPLELSPLSFGTMGFGTTASCPFPSFAFLARSNNASFSNG